MKLKLAKKISALALAGLAGLFLAGRAVANVKPEFNNNSGDYPLIRVKNVTQGEADYKTFTNANVGDVVRFHLWIHNNVDNSVAEDVTIRALLSGDYTTQQMVRAYLSASNADSLEGSTIVQLAEVGKLEYRAGTTLVYSDVYGSGYQWPNDNIVASGINLGDIQGCWPYVVQISFEAKVKAKPQETENPHLVINKQVSYGDEKDNGRWYDAIGKDTKIFGANDSFYYHVIVENTGNVVIKNVKLEDKLPPYIYWVGGNGSYENGSNLVRADLGDLAVGAKIVVEYQARVKDVLPEGERTQENVVTVESDNYDDLKDSTVVWIKGPQIVTAIVVEEKEAVQQLPETGAHYLLVNLMLALGSLVTGLGFRRLERLY